MATIWVDTPKYSEREVARIAKQATRAQLAFVEEPHFVRIFCDDNVADRVVGHLEWMFGTSIRMSVIKDRL